ncbi:MAG TPA: HisA/HisF-related TIM barrel protein [Methylotenera sp.]|nr:HisA/HisF-related TIM barrel protein [Methylotenera sp.]
MEIIPVIDLMHGQVVHARFGQRQYYQPIQSKLSHSSAPINIVSALLELYPFERLYIADLGAIQGQSNHFQTIQLIKDEFPHLEIWLDSGISCVDDLYALKDLPVCHVIGSENITSIKEILELKQTLGEEFILSLDFNAQGFLGPIELSSNAVYWPNRVIVMTLAKVGSHQGVDLQLLKLFTQGTLNLQVYAAGGVRGLDDLKLVSEIGGTGALIASALHNQQLTNVDLTYASNAL